MLSRTGSRSFLCIAVRKVWFLIRCDSLILDMVIKAIDAHLSSREGKIDRTFRWGDVWVEKDLSFDLSCIVL